MDPVAFMFGIGCHYTQVIRSYSAKNQIGTWKKGVFPVGSFSSKVTQWYPRHPKVGLGTGEEAWWEISTAAIAGHSPQIRTALT